MTTAAPTEVSKSAQVEELVSDAWRCRRNKTIGAGDLRVYEWYKRRLAAIDLEPADYQHAIRRLAAALDV